jgi:CelD/BcsL family acetyltransferase involved in cellulose biosynthesis
MASSTATRLGITAIDAAPTYEIEVVRDERGFDALREDWTALSGRLDVDSPMLSWEWSRLWWDHFRGRNRLCILIFRHAGRVAGIAQLQERRLGMGPMSLRSLKPIGWEDGGNQGLTEHLDLLFPSAERPALLLATSRWLERNGSTIAWLPAIEADEILPSSLQQNIVQSHPYVQFHHRRLPGDWAVFVQGLNKSMRSNARYYPHLLERRGLPFHLEVAATSEQVDAALPVLFELHRIRAESEDVSTVRHWDHFFQRDRRAFMREIAAVLAARGQLKVGLLRIGDEVVAAQMWFEERTTISLYYSGFLPSWAKYSVALVTTLEVFKQGMRRGFDRVEFLRGGGQLKERWDTEVRLSRDMLWASRPGLARAGIKAGNSSERARRAISGVMR